MIVTALCARHVVGGTASEPPELADAHCIVISAIAAKRAAYIAIEEEVHTELLGLAADAQQTLSYIQKALLLFADSLADAAQTHRERGADVSAFLS